MQWNAPLEIADICLLIKTKEEKKERKKEKKKKKKKKSVLLTMSLKLMMEVVALFLGHPVYPFFWS